MAMPLGIFAATPKDKIGAARGKLGGNQEGEAGFRLQLFLQSTLHPHLVLHHLESTTHHLHHLESTFHQMNHN